MTPEKGKKKKKSSEKLHALIKWIQDDTFTPVPLEWVKGFDVDEFLRTKMIDSEESYAVEWRDKKKEPKRGWRCYEGVVMAISRNISKLDKYIDELKGTRSPMKVTESSEVSISSEAEKNSSEQTNNADKDLSQEEPAIYDETPLLKKNEMTKEEKQKKKKKKKKKRRNQDSTEESTPPPPPPPPPPSSSSTPPPSNSEMNGGWQSESDEFLDRPSPIRPNSSASYEASGPGKKRRHGIDDRTSNKRPKSSTFRYQQNFCDTGDRSTMSSEAVSMNDLMTAIQTTNKNLTQLQKRLDVVENRPGLSHGEPYIRRFPNQAVVPPYPPATYNTEESEYARYLTLEKVEIGRPGSNVCITADQWETAADKNTFTKMTSSLLVALFPEEVLLQSNLKGGRSKIDKNAEHYEALDERRIRALQYTVRKKFPQTFLKRMFGSCINNKLGQMRREYYGREY